jgi:hypothetical protein
MEAQSKARVNALGITVLFEAERPMIEWVPLLLILFLRSRVRFLTC